MDINDFLIEAKKRINSGKLDIVPTAKNKLAYRKHGLTILDIEDLLKSLTPSDLKSGPEEDRDFPGEYVYIFGKKISDGTLFYVKIKLKNNLLKCLSCHDDKMFL
ncbi:MAG: hypothetical protein PHX04_01375 [Bacilli bacterium]|nr:hypothetical protein [Bacilli bacterium]